MDIYSFDKFWLSTDEYDRRLDYLRYSFEKIEKELFDSFDILPLREENLDTFSMFYADFCIRTYPILTIGFNLTLFGERMKDAIRVWFQLKNDSGIDFKIDLGEVYDDMNILYEKFKEKKDGIRDYYRIFKNQTSFGLILSLDHKISTEYHVGKIELEMDLQPFKKGSWNEYLLIRNSIVHRGKIEAQQKTALNSLGCLYNILYHLGYYGSRISLNSNIFGDFGKPITFFNPYTII